MPAIKNQRADRARSKEPIAENLETSEGSSESANNTESEPISRDAAGRALGTLFGWVPSAVVLASLAGIGWYGHHNDWKLPSAAVVAGAKNLDAPGWCESHGVPASDCILCVEGLVERAPKLTFCNAHGVHGCLFENPALVETNQPAMVEQADLQRAERALALRRRDENLPISSTVGTRIQFVSTDAMKKAGVDVDLVVRRPIAETIRAAGEIRYDETKLAFVSPPADGTIDRVLANVGDWVEEGQPLAVIDSREVGKLKSRLVAAIAQEFTARNTHERLSMTTGGAVSGGRKREAKNEFDQAAAAVDEVIVGLTNLGIRIDANRLRESELPEVRKSVFDARVVPGSTERLEGLNQIVVVSPIEGRVVDRMALIGDVVDRGSQLFRVVDTRSVWLDLRVPSEDASLVREGQKTLYIPDGSDDKRRGEVTWISTEVDPQTRTVRVRAELDNADGSLRDESFGTGQLVLREEDEAICVPESALQWEGTSHVIFVRDARFFEEDRPKFFVTRSVRPGVRVDGYVEIIAGTVPGEVVATEGSDVLRAQLLRANLGPGCTCGH